MARAAGGGASAPSSSFASLERTLDRTVECLVAGTQDRQARARLIEARRLRSVVANWRSIPPAPDVLDDMLARVLQLSTSVGVVETGDPVVAVPREREEEETEAYALDFEPQLYSLETGANRKAVPVPPPDAEEPEYGDASPHSEAHSEDEPTRAWSNASVRPPPDFEAASVPAPWPVDEPPDRISSVVGALPNAGVAAITRPSTPPLPLPLPASAEAAASASAAATAVSSPDLAPPDDAAPLAARVVTYEFDAEGDDLSVPRTQIAAHTVKLSDPPNPLLVVLTDPYSPRTDAYRTLRRKLAALPNTRVLGITSANPGEGKTVFALNLALTLRESAKSRVLVVEANLRAPIMGKLLGFETPECFLAQLKRHDEDPRAPWVVAEPLPKLHVMAIDPALPRDPLLDPVTFSAGMERLKQAGYDHVIVDSPPVLGSLDCNVISDAVDAMILTALPMKSLRREMRKAVEQLEPAPVLGVVVLEA